MARTHRQVRPRTGSPELDAAVVAVVEAAQLRRDEDLLTEMVATVVKIARESSDRGDVKIVNTALRELRQSYLTFAPFRDRRKASIFGSARIAPNTAAYLAAEHMGAALAAAGWMVITGGGPGIMTAGVEGAGRENSFGITIRLPFEPPAGPTVVERDHLVRFRYFFTRKLTFMKESSAYVVFPGGFGTLDETFELLTLMQTGKEPPSPVILFEPEGNTYWSSWLEFVTRELVPAGLVAPADLSLVTITSSVDDAVAEICDFYANFHSMRWVDDQLVLRLERPLSAARLAELQVDFADIVSSGTLELIGPFPVELEDEDEVDRPRLALRFDNRQFARLTQLVRALSR